jgi:hypothetical protein
MAVPVAQAKGVYAAGTTSFVANAPGGILAGDHLLIVMESADSMTAAGTPDTPAGFTKLFEETQNVAANATTLTIFDKIAAGGETDVTVTGVLDHCSGTMFVIRGASASIGDVVVGTGNGGATLSVTLLSITTIADNSLVVMAVCSRRDITATNQFDAWANTNLTGITEWEDNVTSTGNGGGIGVAYGTKALAGATGNSTCDMSGTLDWRSVQIAFKSLAVPGGRARKRFYGPALLGTGAADLYTVPAGTRTVIQHIHAFNAAGSPVNFTLSIGTDAASTRLWDAYPVESKGIVRRYRKLTLQAGEKIQGFASAGTSIVLVINGYEEGP